MSCRYKLESGAPCRCGELAIEDGVVVGHYDCVGPPGVPSDPAFMPPLPTWSEAINDWQRTTFGPATPERAWGRFSEEFEEMVEAECEPAEHPEKIAEEAADVVITLVGWLNARCPGQDLATAIERKMAINRARQWDVRDGVGYHVKAGEKTGGAE